MKIENIEKTETYNKWVASLKDRNALARINTRVRRLSLGNPGDVKHFSGGISEMKIDYGPGYRVYYTTKRNIIYILLCGRDKATQQADIEKARKLSKELEV